MGCNVSRAVDVSNTIASVPKVSSIANSKLHCFPLSISFICRTRHVVRALACCLRVEARTMREQGDLSPIDVKCQHHAYDAKGLCN